MTKEKDLGYKIVVIGAILFLTGLFYDIIVILFIPSLYHYTFVAIILATLGTILVSIGGLTKSVNNKEKSSNDENY